MNSTPQNFFTQLAKILNADQSHSVTLCGNVYDLFNHEGNFVPLIPYLCEKTKVSGLIRLVYELNGPIRVLDDRERLKNAWIAWKSGVDVDTLLVRAMREKGPSTVERLSGEFDQLMLDAIGNSTLALEMLRQLTICSRSSHLKEHLLIFIEAADMLLPAGNGDVASLSDGRLRRISIVQDWFSDPAFMEAGDSVVLIAESRSLIHPRVARLPQVLSVEVKPPNAAERLEFIEAYLAQSKSPPKLWADAKTLADFTAGLSLHALRQLLTGAAYSNEVISPGDVVDQVEQFIQSQVGEDVVEFKKPSHSLKQVVGFTKLKRFLREELVPRFRASGEQALAGAAVAGPIGGGKTFIFEALAGELDVPVLVLKSIRSQWYGQTDVIFERLRRVLEALDKVLIFVDEADTQFGGVGAETQDTERRLTGKIQAMMSDPRLRGRVIWLLMTARIHLLSPDIRRPGRVGDLIIPVLDPEDGDRREFIRWVLSSCLKEPDEGDVDRLDRLTMGYSAAAFASLRSHLKAVRPATLEEILVMVEDQIPPAIGVARRYQTLQALVNCTRRSLLPNPTVSDSERESWAAEIRALEAQGVS